MLLLQLNIPLVNILCHYLLILLSVDRVICSFVLFVTFGGQNVKESQWMELLVPGVCEYLG